MFGLTGIWLKLAELGVLIVFVFGAYIWIGHHAVSEYKDSQKIVQAEADRKQQAKYNLVAQELEDSKRVRQENAKTITKVVEKIVDRPVYLNECMDDDGLRIANDAIAGRGASKPETAMPANTTY